MTTIFSGDSFMCITVNENVLISYRILDMYVKFETYFQKFDQWKFSISQGSGLVPIRRQAPATTNADHVSWRMDGSKPQ